MKLREFEAKHELVKTQFEELQRELAVKDDEMNILRKDLDEEKKRYSELVATLK